MKKTVYPASERGHVSFGWLDTYHSFSFGEWNNPDKVHFGALRVLNDDKISGGGGFGMHPHDNMEIVTIPVKGTIAHKDSIGTNGLIKAGDVQIMSAGTGIRHSEYNPSPSDALELFQIWVFPKLRNVKPRYEQKSFNETDRVNRWQVLVSPDPADNGLSINQDARFALTNLEKGKEISFEPKFKGNGVYVYVIEGAVSVDGQTLGKRDAIGISDFDALTLKADQAAQVLAIEVPMLS